MLLSVSDSYFGEGEGFFKNSFVYASIQSVMFP